MLPSPLRWKRSMREPQRVLRLHLDGVWTAEQLAKTLACVVDLYNLRLVLTEMVGDQNAAQLLRVGTGPARKDFLREPERRSAGDRRVAVVVVDHEQRRGPDRRQATKTRAYGPRTRSTRDAVPRLLPGVSTASLKLLPAPIRRRHSSASAALMRAARCV